METTNLTQEYVRKLFNYENGELSWKIKKARRTVVGKPITYKCTCGYRQVRIDTKLYFVHRIIFLYHKGYLPEYVDHINNNPLDNRIENLRECTLTENMLNRKIAKNNTSGFKNVRFNVEIQKWSVSMRVNGKKTYFGSYDTLETAIKVAEETRNKYHGEFANNGENK